MKIEEQIALAKTLGLDTAVEQAKKDRKMVEKLAKAYSEYAFVPQEKIDAFNAKLKSKSVKTTGTAGKDLVEHYDKLLMVPVAQYAGLPPVEVLAKLKTAKEAGIFDTFEVASIESVHDYKDPILFGRIEGCTDRFFLAEWGEDVNLADLFGA